MKKVFYIALVLLLIFEILRVYVIMPFPGSQVDDTVQLAYSLHSIRWYVRIVLGIIVLLTAGKVWVNSRPRLRVLPIVVALIVLTLVTIINFKFTADSMFLQPKKLVFARASGNAVPMDALVLSVSNNGETKAYPLQYIIYHHQVRDRVGGKEIMVTYCNVCRTGRVFSPEVDGKSESFRLVGMDHFNAMFEDRSSGSWWRQATGEAIAGPKKGTTLSELNTYQTTLRTLLTSYPFALIMQPDSASMNNYDPEMKFEQGLSLGSLTRTDTASWKDKSWIVGIEQNGLARAYDWNLIKKQRVIVDTLGELSLAIAISSDDRSYQAFKLDSISGIIVNSDTLVIGNQKFDFSGRNFDGQKKSLKRINAYQEFWHSWETFHPLTTRYSP